MSLQSDSVYVWVEELHFLSAYSSKRFWNLILKSLFFKWLCILATISGLVLELMTWLGIPLSGAHLLYITTNDLEFRWLSAGLLISCITQMHIVLNGPFVHLTRLFDSGSQTSDHWQMFFPGMLQERLFSWWCWGLSLEPSACSVCALTPSLSPYP